MSAPKKEECFLKQKGMYLKVYTNPSKYANRTHIFAVISFCYGNDEDSISLTYSRVGADQFGFDLPRAPVLVDARPVEIPMVSGCLFGYLVNSARRALESIKSENDGRLPSGRLFKVYSVDKRLIVESLDSSKKEQAA